MGYPVRPGAGAAGAVQVAGRRRRGAGTIYIEPDMGAGGLDAAFFDIFNNASDDVHHLVLDRDGVLRLVSARGPSASAAKTALRHRLADRAATASDAGGITSTTTIAALCSTWIAT